MNAVKARNHSELNLSVYDQLKRYLDHSVDFDVELDVFKWWFENKHICPALYDIAIAHLIISATSADSERIFSTAGLILSTKRSNLTSEHLDLCFALRIKGLADKLCNH